MAHGLTSAQLRVFDLAPKGEVEMFLAEKRARSYQPRDTVPPEREAAALVRLAQLAPPPSTSAPQVDEEPLEGSRRMRTRNNGKRQMLHTTNGEIKRRMTPNVGDMPPQARRRKRASASSGGSSGAPPMQAMQPNSGDSRQSSSDMPSLDKQK